MASMAWFRSWHGAPTDHKWAVIAARSGAKVGVVSAVAWALLGYASQHAERGTVDGFDTETYSVYSGFPEAEIEAIIKAMTDKGIITNGRLANWEKRQPKREDDSTERVRNYREMKRNVTHGNAETDAETLDKDTDKEESSRTAAPASSPSSGGGLNHDAIEITAFQRVTGMMGYPGSKRELTLDAMNGLRVRYPTVDALAEYMKPFFEEWVRRGFSKSNTAWLYDWALSGQIPAANGNSTGKGRGKRSLLEGKF